MLILFLLPRIVFGACSPNRFTVVYINGVFTNNIKDAEDDTLSLQDEFSKRSGLSGVDFITGYNPSHIGGLGDLAETLSQMYNKPISNYDRDTILQQIYSEIKTRKLLLVGHSQGTFYTNEIYDYLLAHGEPKESVGVYNVATPASIVPPSCPSQCDGKYLTSENDKVINLARNFAQKFGAKQPLPANISIPLTPQEAADSHGGHSFSGVYLANASVPIVSSINDMLKNLVAIEVPDTAGVGCFIPPVRDIAYYTGKAFFFFADPTATGVVAAKNSTDAANSIVYNVASAAGQAAYNGVLAVVQSAVAAAETVYRNAGKLFTSTAFSKGLALITNYFSSSEPPNTAVVTNNTVIPDSNSGSPNVSSDIQIVKENISQSVSNPAVSTEQASPVISQASSEVTALSSGTTQSKESTSSTAALYTFLNSTTTVGGAGTVSSPAPAPASASPTAPSPANHIVISEVLFHAAGSDVGKQFVELYNPNGTQLDLTGWLLKYQTENSATIVSLASFKPAAHPEDTALIPSKGFLLVGLNDYDAANYSNKLADVKRTASSTLPSGQAAGGGPEKIELILSDASGAEIDRVTYDKNSIASAGQTIERKVVQSGACASPQGSNEFSGNDCDTDADSDFTTRSSPNPQNSASLPEPRSAPAANNLQITYNFAPRFDFSWNLSSDASGATSTLSYSISDTTNLSSTTLLFETSSTASTTYAYTINEVGRNYNFKFTVQDRDGLSSAPTSTIAAKSFLDNTYFYRDTRGAGTGYLFDVTATSSRPFWDKSDTSNTSDWRAIVFYLNKAAPKQSIISTADDLIPSDSAFMRVKYSTCAGGETSKPELLFPFNNYSCQSGGLMSGAHLFSNLEDQRFTVKLASSTSDISFSSSDYTTLAFYDFEGGGGGSQRLKLAAVDTTNYHFQTTAATQNAPTTPGNFSVVLNSVNGKLDLSWTSSTDSDTRDSLIHYEVNFSTSSVLSDSAWRSTTSLLSTSTIPVFPNTYKLGVRAVDDFSNASTPSTLTYNFPSGFVLTPSQLNHDDNIGPDGYGQQILMGSAATIGGVAFFLEPNSSPFSSGQLYVEIHQDSSNSIGALIATSTAITFNQFDAQAESVFSFSPGVLLNASSSYWLALKKGPVVRNGAAVFGTNSNSYSDGFWSSNSARDAYFRLVQQ